MKIIKFQECIETSSLSNLPRINVLARNVNDFDAFSGQFCFYKHFRKNNPNLCRHSEPLQDAWKYFIYNEVEVNEQSFLRSKFR